MPPPTLFDMPRIDMDHPQVTREQIYQALPHRHEFMQLDGILHVNRDRREVVALRRVRPDEWWCKGHLPGRPLLPGVLMLESAAHVAAYFYAVETESMRFLAFSGVDRFKFRETVTPPANLVILGKAVEVKPRRTICDVQGFVGDTMIFEGQIIGMPI